MSRNKLKLKFFCVLLWTVTLVPPSGLQVNYSMFDFIFKGFYTLWSFQSHTNDGIKMNKRCKRWVWHIDLKRHLNPLHQCSWSDVLKLGHAPVYCPASDSGLLTLNQSAAAWAVYNVHVTPGWCVFQGTALPSGCVKQTPGPWGDVPEAENKNKHADCCFRRGFLHRILCLDSVSLKQMDWS